MSHSLLGACCASLSLLVAAGAIGAPPELVYSRAAGALLIEFDERPGELAPAEFASSLRIYGDGRYTVRRPSGMRRAGEYEGKLPPAEVHALLRRLLERGVLDFDAARLRRAPRVARGQLERETSDPSALTLVIRAARGLPAGVPAPERRIRVRGLRAAARAAPDDAALAGLAASCAELRGMIDAAGRGAPQ